MKYRRFGRAGWEVSEISLGTWQVGGGWGKHFDAAVAERILERALDAGVNFFDTADVYYDGLSEKAVGAAVRRRQSAGGRRIHVATKCGRFISPHVDSEYTPERLVGFVEQSLRNSGLDQLTLVQLHCPPSESYRRNEIFSCFDKLHYQGKVGHMGVSVERIEEAHQAMLNPLVASVQIVYNAFRQRPRDQLFAFAAEQDVAILVRIPLASGLLSGVYTADSTFGVNDHRHFNREGKAFDRGETFSGVPYDVGLAAVEELRPFVSPPLSMAQFALRWILDSPQVSCVIPGASRPEQVDWNCAASDADSLTAEQHAAVTRVYDEYIRPHVHHLW